MKNFKWIFLYFQKYQNEKEHEKFKNQKNDNNKDDKMKDDQKIIVDKKEPSLLINKI